MKTIAMVCDYIDRDAEWIGSPVPSHIPLWTILPSLCIVMLIVLVAVYAHKQKPKK